MRNTLAAGENDFRARTLYIIQCGAFCIKGKCEKLVFIAPFTPLENYFKTVIYSTKMYRIVGTDKSLSYAVTGMRNEQLA